MSEFKFDDYETELMMKLVKYQARKEVDSHWAEGPDESETSDTFKWVPRACNWTHGAQAYSDAVAHWIYEELQAECDEVYDADHEKMSQY